MIKKQSINSKAKSLDEKNYSFKFKKLPDLELLESSNCSCCLLAFKRVYPEERIEDGLRPMVCYGCSEICHRYCYGLATPVKEEDGVLYFVCDSCSINKQNAPTCSLCNNTGGLMKELKDEGFIHLACGFTHMEVNVINYTSLEFKKVAFYTDNNATCEICHKQNAYFKCSQQKCNMRSHPFCVMKSYRQKELAAEQEEQDAEIKNCWKFFMSPGESKLYSGAQQQHSCDKEINDFVSENKDNRINSDLVRGGFQFVLCPQHFQRVFYCNCGKDVDEEDLTMVFCDCCLEWYHPTCVNYKKGKEEDQEDWICPFCVKWSQLKTKILREIKSDKLENYELKLQRNPKLYIPDFILFAIACEFRLNKIIESGGNTSRIIKTIEFYPLKLTKQAPPQKVIQNNPETISSLEQIQYWINSNKQSKQVDIAGSRHIEDLWETIEAEHKNTEKYIKTRINYLTTWTNIIKRQDAKVSLTLAKAKGLLYEYYEILKKYMMVSSPIMRTLKEPITYLESLFERIIAAVQKINKCSSVADLDDISEHVGSIDISELLLEAKIFWKSKKVLNIPLRLRKPYADLNKFYQEFNRVSQLLQEEKIEFKDQPSLNKKTSSISEELREKQKTVELIIEKDKYRKEQRPLQRVRQKINLKQKPKQRQSDRFEQPRAVDKTALNVVSEEDRSVITKILTSKMLANRQFAGMKADDFVKIIQNQIFGEFHKNRNKYLTLSESFQKVFMILLQCPLISMKAKKKNFEYIFMKELIDNMSKIKEIEQKLRVKQKQKGDKEKEQKPEVKQEGLPDIAQKNEVFKSIFSGKIEGKLEKQLEEIYSLKKDADKERRMKNSHSRYDDDRGRRNKHDRRDRSQSRQKGRRHKRADSNEKETARFSEDEESPDHRGGYNPLAGLGSEEKNKDSPAQKEKQKELMKEFQNINKMTIEPILYDPEDEQREVDEKLEKQMEKGVGIIRIKACQIEMSLYKEKKSFEGFMYTMEDPRRIKQLCDPCFQKLTIRKDKPEGEILDYLLKGNSRKYRFLIGWLETQKQSNNQYLRDLAIDCEEKGKVFGIQNDLAKIHIMSSRQLNKQMMIYKFKAPNKVSTEAAAKYLNQHRMVFVLQISIEKLYDMKTVSNPFMITPIPTFANVVSEVVYDQYKHNNLPQQQMQIQSIAPIHSLTSQTNINVDRRNQVFIDTWDADPVPMPVAPHHLHNRRKQFSPITSEDEEPRSKDNFNPNKQKIDIMKLIGELDQSKLSQLTLENKYPQQDQQKQQQNPSVPRPLAFGPSQIQRQHQPQPSSYLYQQRMPSQGNQMIQRPPGMSMPMQISTYTPQGYGHQQNQMRHPPQQQQPQPRFPQQQNMNQAYYPPGAGFIPPPPGQYQGQ